MPKEKSSRRDRRRDSSRSSVSSEASYKQKKSKSKHKRRSRSRDRSEADSTYSMSSRSKHKSRRRDSHSSSRHRNSHKYKRRSFSRDRVKSYRRSPSRERARSGSSSRSKHKSSRNKKSSRRRSQSDSSSSRKSSPSVKSAKIFAKIIIPKDDIESKVEKAIKAAEAAGLTMSRLPAYEYKEVEVREDMPTIHDRNLLDELNSETFVPKQFTSIKNIKLPDNIVIDLDAEMVQGPAEVPKSDSLFHPSLFPDEESQKSMWIKKLLKHRRMVLRGDL